MLPPRLGGGTGARKQGTGGAGPRHGASHGVLSQGMWCERRAGKYGAGTLRASSPRSAVGPSSGCPGLPSAVGTLPCLVGPPLSVQRPAFGPGSPSVLGFNSHFSLPCSVRLPLCLLWAFCSCSGSPAVLGLPLWFGSPLPGGPPAHLSASHFVVVLPSPLGLPASFRPLLPAGPCPWCTHGVSAAGEGARAVTACPAPLSAEPGPRSGSGGTVLRRSVQGVGASGTAGTSWPQEPGTGQGDSEVHWAPRPAAGAEQPPKHGTGGRWHSSGLFSHAQC